MQSTSFASIGNHFLIPVASEQLDARAKKTAIIFAIVALTLALFIAAIYQHNKSQKITASPLPYKPQLPDSIESKEPQAVAPTAQTSQSNPLEISGVTTPVVKESQTVDVDRQELPKEVPSISALEEIFEKVRVAAKVVETPKSESQFVPAATDVKGTKKADFDWESEEPFASEQELLDNALSCRELKTLYDQVQTVAKASGRPEWKLKFLPVKEISANSFLGDGTFTQSEFLPRKKALSTLIWGLAHQSLFFTTIDKEAKRGKFTCEEYAKAKTKESFDSAKLYHTTMQAAVRAYQWKTSWEPEPFSTFAEDLTNVEFEEHWDKNKTSAFSKMYRSEFVKYYASFSHGWSLREAALSFPVIKEHWDKLDSEEEWRVVVDLSTAPLTREISVDFEQRAIHVSNTVDRKTAIHLLFAGILQALGEGDAAECELLALKKLEEAHP